MKLKKLVILMISFLVVAGLTACAKKEEKTLIIYQNKVEIDEVLSTYAQAWGEANDVTVEVKTCGGDTCAYGTQILAEFQSEKQPDIFVIEGMGGYNIYKDKMLSFTGDAWIDNTELELKVDGKVFGFPVAVEGWGMAYNKKILDAAGVDIAALKDVSQAEYDAAFAKVQAYYDANNMADYTVV